LRVLFDGNVVIDIYATNRARMHKVMIEAGLQEVRFDFEGTKILTMD
jgi:hypothetical protein